MANEVKIIITGDTARAVGESSSFVSRIKKHWLAICIVLGIEGDYEIHNRK